jgi:hypothetical protein
MSSPHDNINERKEQKQHKHRNAGLSVRTNLSRSHSESIEECGYIDSAPIDEPPHSRARKVHQSGSRHKTGSRSQRGGGERPAAAAESISKPSGNVHRKADGDSMRWNGDSEIAHRLFPLPDERRRHGHQSHHGEDSRGSGDNTKKKHGKKERKREDEDDKKSSLRVTIGRLFRGKKLEGSG